MSRRTGAMVTAAAPLILVGSGCGLFTEAVADLNVIAVQVAPTAGKGPFTANVEVSAHSSDSKVRCFATPTGQDITYGSMIYEALVAEARTNATFTFDFTPPQAGLQQVVCADAPSGKSRPDERPQDQTRSNEFTVPIEATGVRSDFATDGTTSCDVPTTVTLTIMPGGQGQLVSNAPGVVDHNNCIQASGGSPVSWIADGTANPDFQVVTFTSCNDGRFQGTGLVSYAGGTLKGSVTCSKDGTTWVTVKMG